MNFLIRTLSFAGVIRAPVLKKKSVIYFLYLNQRIVGFELITLDSFLINKTLKNVFKKYLLNDPKIIKRIKTDMYLNQ